MYIHMVAPIDENIIHRQKALKRRHDVEMIKVDLENKAWNIKNEKPPKDFHKIVKRSRWRKFIRLINELRP